MTTNTTASNATNVHPTAEVHKTAAVGRRTRIWHRSQIGAGVRIGTDCIIGAAVSVWSGATIGNRVKIQTGCGVFGATIEDDVLIAPGVYLLEDHAPRASTPDGVPKTGTDWSRQPVTVRAGASIGASAVVAPGVTIGRYALIAIGTVVHRDVPDYALIAGNPGRHVGWVCACGQRLTDHHTCPRCGLHYQYSAVDNRLQPIRPAR